MTGICVIAGSSERLAALRAMLPSGVAADFLQPHELLHNEPQGTALLDIDLGQSVNIEAVRTWLSTRSRRGTVIVCVDDAASYLQLTQARALGGSVVLPRPFDAEALQRMLYRLGKIPARPLTQPAINDVSPDLHAIEDIFTAAHNGQIGGMDLTTRAAVQIVDRLRDIGLSAYLSAVRNHHSRTYTHCLTVTAIAIAFGIQLGFSRRDTERLAVAGLLHDIGKANIPIELLEKPAALDEDEALVMRSHAVLGYDMLRGTPGLPDDTLDMVLHHHEYLDGTGYPHGLSGSQITDLNRMITIADVYGALIEPRSYKPALSATQSFDTLVAMGPKLDGALVRVFAPIAANLTD